MNDNNPKIKIGNEGIFTISKIEQLCFIASAFFFSRKYICDRANYIYNNPGDFNFPYNKDLILGNFKTIKNQNPELFQEDGVGNFLNKMVIVNSGSVLENYLRKIGKIFQLNKDEIEPCPECGYKKEPLPYSFDGIAKRLYDIVRLDKVDGYDQSCLLTLIRHKIIHNQGKADKKFLKEIKKNKCEEARHFDITEVCTDISTPIDQIIIPCLEKSSNFVANSSNQFIEKYGEKNP